MAEPRIGSPAQDRFCLLCEDAIRFWSDDKPPAVARICRDILGYEHFDTRYAVEVFNHRVAHRAAFETHAVIRRTRLATDARSCEELVDEDFHERTIVLVRSIVLADTAVAIGTSTDSHHCAAVAADQSAAHAQAARADSSSSAL